MALQHSQYNCPTCKRPTMHVRNTYDVPHVLHLLVSVFLCGLWLPVWFAHTLLNEIAPGEPWRCQNCGTGRGLFGGSQRGGNAMRPVKPAGPSTRAKASGDKCPACGGAMIAGVELGEAVLTCPGCGRAFEQA